MNYNTGDYEYSLEDLLMDYLIDRKTNGKHGFSIQKKQQPGKGWPAYKNSDFVFSGQDAEVKQAPVCKACEATKVTTQNMMPPTTPSPYPNQNFTPYPYPNQNPDMNPNQNPNQNPNMNPNQNTNQNPNMNPNQNPNMNPNQNPNQNPNMNPNPNGSLNPPAPNQGYNNNYGKPSAPNHFEDPAKADPYENDLQYRDALYSEVNRKLAPYVEQVLDEFEQEDSPLYKENEITREMIAQMVDRVIDLAGENMPQVEDITQGNEEYTRQSWPKSLLLRTLIESLVLHEIYSVRRPRYRLYNRPGVKKIFY